MDYMNAKEALISGDFQYGGFKSSANKVELMVSSGWAMFG